jgi:hypothetical protein
MCLLMTASDLSDQTKHFQYSKIIAVDFLVVILALFGFLGERLQGVLQPRGFGEANG